MTTPREQIAAQHDEICDLFEQIRVCPSGARCQKIHLYPDNEDQPLIKALDVLIGGVKDISERMIIMEEQLKAIIDHLEIDRSEVQQRGRSRATHSQGEFVRQVKARSASSDGARSRPRSISVTEEIHPLVVPPQVVQQHPSTPQQYAFYPQYNPPFSYTPPIRYQSTNSNKSTDLQSRYMFMWLCFVIIFSLVILISTIYLAWTTTYQDVYSNIFPT